MLSIAAKVFSLVLAIIALSKSYVDFRGRRESFSMLVFWTGTWVLIIVFALFPSLVDVLLSFSGSERVGLGTFFGMALVFLYFIVYRLYVKLERIEQNLIKVGQAPVKSKAKVADTGMPDWWVFAGLGLLILVFYANSFSAALLFDSESIIKLDTRLREVTWATLQNIFTHSYWWPTDESNLYRPLTTLTYWFNYSVLGSGENVTGYHVGNFLLHWLNTWIVFLIVRRLAGRLDIAALTAALFAVHPVNTEAVTNVVGRADLLAALAFLFGGWCYLRGWLVGLAVAACAGVLAKEN